VRKLLTTEEAADLLGVTPNTMMDWRQMGKGPRHAKVGHLVKYRPEDLEAYVEANMRTTTNRRARAAEASA
jgi:excisionase family DNA binding protein